MKDPACSSNEVSTPGGRLDDVELESLLRRTAEFLTIRRLEAGRRAAGVLESVPTAERDSET